MSSVSIVLLLHKFMIEIVWFRNCTLFQICSVEVLCMCFFEPFLNFMELNKMCMITDRYQYLIISLQILNHSFQNFKNNSNKYTHKCRRIIYHLRCHPLKVGFKHDGFLLFQRAVVTSHIFNCNKQIQYKLKRYLMVYMR